jgi:hypothetical protein
VDFAVCPQIHRSPAVPWHDRGVPSFACPRCDTEVTQEFYGPCDPCRWQLRAEQGRDPIGTVTDTSYEPKMNVTPNAVALKE